MTKVRSGMHANRRGRVKEFLTDATLPALNGGLANRGIDPHAIITIVEMPGPTRATPPRFRVLYEVH
jgi:hypothetical protein